MIANEVAATTTTTSTTATTEINDCRRNKMIKEEKIYTNKKKTSAIPIANVMMLYSIQGTQTVHDDILAMD